MAQFIANNSGNYQTILDVNQASQNINNNTTTVNVRLFVRKLSGTGYWSNNTSSWSLNVGGHVQSGNFTYDFRGITELNLFIGSFTIAHNGDGTKTIGNSASVYLEGLGTANPSGNMTLSTIPRASSLIGLPTSFIIGTSIPFTIERASGSFTHTVYLRRSSDDLYITTELKLATSGTLNPTAAEQDIVYEMIPKATSIALGIRIITYNGSTLIGYKDYNINAIVGDNIVPTFTTITHSENVTNVKNLVGAYVQKMSRLNMAITGATGAKFSTITGYKIEVDKQVLNASNGVTQTIESAGTVVAKATVTDSRGRTTTKTVNISVLAYNFPNIKTNPKLIRCNSSGVEDPIGTYVKVSIDAGVSSLKVGTTEKNKLTYKIESQPRNTTTWTQKVNKLHTTTNYKGDNIVTSYTIDSAFNFKISITDIFNTTIALDLVPNGKVTMQWGSDYISVGKTFDQGSIDAAGQIYQNDGKPVVGLDKKGTSYFGLTQEDGDDTGWLRTTTNGLLPHTQGGSGAIGTSSWPFNNGYFNNLFVAGKRLPFHDWISLKQNFEITTANHASKPYKLPKTGVIKNIRIITKTCGIYEFYDVPSAPSGGLFFGIIRDGISEYRLFPNANTTEMHFVYMGGNHKLEVADLQYTL